MPKCLGSAALLVVCQRRFEPSRVEQQLWSEAYGQLLPEGRGPQAGVDSAVPCRRKQAPRVSPIFESLEEKSA